MTNKLAKGSRLAFVDNLRILLTVLVILHHLVSMYGGPGDWYYKEGRLEGIALLLLTLFMVVNQTFFMGLFYLLSGYFAPASYDRKGGARFLIDRLVRLGIPLLVYALLINPFIRYVTEVGFLALNRNFFKIWGWNGAYWTYAARFVRDRRSSAVGPMWFVEALLIFTLIYWAWRVLARREPVEPQLDARPPSNAAIAVFALALGVVTFLVRIRLPIGTVLLPLGLQFPYFPQYVAAFVVGIVAYQRNWLRGIPDATGRLWQTVALVLIALFPIILSVAGGNVNPFMGGLRWEAAFNAFWEQALGVAMMVSLVVLFRNRLNQQGALTKAMAASSYAAFILHGPVLALLAVGIKRVQQPPVVKIAVLAPVAVFLCFFIGFLLGKLPLLRRVL
jgi:fucose 4-O-acetylase-like acetyltransferase